MSSLLNEIEQASPQTRELLAPYLGINDTSPEPLSVRLKLVLNHAGLEKVRFIIESLINLDSRIARAAIDELAQSLQKNRIELSRGLLQHFSEIQSRNVHVEKEENIIILLRNLKNAPDPSVRVQAAKRLGELIKKGEKGASYTIVIQVLKKGLMDECLEVVNSCMHTLLFGSTSNTLHSIENLIKIVSKQFQEDVIDFLGQQGPAGMQALLRLRGFLTMSAMKSLNRWQFDETVNHCLGILGKEGLGNRSDAVGIITDLGKFCPLQPPSVFQEHRNRCLTLLESMLNDSQPRIRLESFIGLIRLESPLWKDHARRLMKDSDASVREAAVKRLADDPDQGDVDLILNLSKKDQGIHSAVVDVLFQLVPDNDTRMFYIKWLADSLDAEVSSKCLDLIARIGNEDDLSLVKSKFNASEWRLRESALRAAVKISPSQATEFALKFLTDTDKIVSEAALDILKNEMPKVELVEALLNKLRQARGNSMLVIMNFLRKYFPERWVDAINIVLKSNKNDLQEMGLNELREHRDVFEQFSSIDKWKRQIVKLLKSDDWTIRKRCLDLIAETGDEDYLPFVIAKFEDEEEEVIETALEAAVKISPSKAKEFSLKLLTHWSEQVSEAALEILKNELSEANMINTLFKKLPRAKGEAGAVILSALRTKAPNRWHEALEVALKSRSQEARIMVSQELAQVPSALNISKLKKLLEDKDEDVRRTAMNELLRLLPIDEQKDIVLSMLGDRSVSIRNDAIQKLSILFKQLDRLRKTKVDRKDPLFIESLLPLARDENHHIRCLTINMLSHFDDVRVFSELLSSLNDVDDRVRKDAQAILNRRPHPVPIVARLSKQFGTSLWEKIKAKVDDINRWASVVGQELLGKPVTAYNYRQGLGRTGISRKKNIVIEVSDTPVTSGHPFGEDIMRGLALHEIGHHLYHIGIKGHSATRGIARSEGVGEIYDYLADEQLERALRSRRPEWGVYFDRLASYAFAQDTHEFALQDYADLVEQSPQETRQAIVDGRLPGQLLPMEEKDQEEKVVLKDGDMLLIPCLVPVQTAFLACLRCGFDPAMCADPRVARAIDLVPDDLKDMEPKDVLEAARKIGDVIGRSDNYKKEMKRFLQRARQHRRMLRQLMQAMGRLAETGQLQEWICQGASGIRKNLPATEPESLPVAAQRNLPSIKLKLPGGKHLNLGKELDFPALVKEETLPVDSVRQAQLAATIRKHIRRMRGYFERLGMKTVEQYASRRGRRLDLPRITDLIMKGNPNVMVHSHDEMVPDAYIGLLIDRSGSMHGEKIARARAFGVLVAESLKGLRGIEGHVNAFNDDTFIRLGDFQRNAIASLESGGGNNDAGALQKAADLALRSGKRHKLLVMISDGSPTECTFESLKNLVAKLTRDYDIICAQVAVQQMKEIAFPHYVDLSQYSFDEAVARFGNLLMKLTASWR